MKTALWLVLGLLGCVHSARDEQLRPRDHIDRTLLPEEEGASSADGQSANEDATLRFLKRLQSIYQRRIKPAEKEFHYNDLHRHSLTLSSSYIYERPTVLVLGPKSTGKTTAINYILGEKLAKSTKSFTALTYGKRERTRDAESVKAGHFWWQQTKAANELQKELTITEAPNPLLQHLSFIDSPGLNGKVSGHMLENLQLLASHADMIMVFLDIHNVAINKELGKFIRELNGQQKNLRIVLNKADSLSEQQLVRKSGSLHWSMSRLLNATEPPKVFMASLHDQPYTSQQHAQLLADDEQMLMEELRKLVDNRIRSKVEQVQQHAKRIRRHAQLVDRFITAYRQNRRTSEKEDRDLVNCIINFPAKYGVSQFDKLHRELGKYPKEYKRYFKANKMHDQKLICERCVSIDKCSFNLLTKALEIDLPKLLASLDGDKCIQTPKESTDTVRKSEDQAVLEPEEKEEEEEEAETEAMAETERLDKHPLPVPMPETDDNSAYSFAPKSQHGFSSEPEQTEKAQKKPEKSKKDKKDKTDKKGIKPDKKTAEPQPIVSSAEAKEQIETVLEKPEVKPRTSTPLAGNEQHSEKHTEKPLDLEKEEDGVGYEQKMYCHFRKSCYYTNEVPDLTVPFVVIQTEENVIIVKEMSLQQQCRWRKSCYDTGQVPNISKSVWSQLQFWTSSPPVQEDVPKPKQDKHMKEQDVDDGEPDDSEMKQRCHWRKSCYDTGIVPDLTLLSRIVIRTPDDELEVVPDSDAIIRQKCKWRISCYESKGFVPVHHVIAEPTQKDDTQKDTEEVKEPKLETKPKQQKQAAPQEHDGDDEAKLTDKQKQYCRWRVSCYSSGIVPDLSKPWFVHVIHDEAAESPINDSEARVKQRCRWRLSCYESGELPDELKASPSFLQHFLELSQRISDALQSRKETKEARQEEAMTEEEDEDDESDKVSNKIKMMCHFRLSCYETGIPPDMAELRRRARPIYDYSDKLPIEEGEIDIRQFCRWRKSCYESGEPPDFATSTSYLQHFFSWLSTMDSLKPSMAAADQVDKQPFPDILEEDEDDSDKVPAETKLKCHWRKSCYESGVVPDLTKKPAVYIHDEVSDEDIDEMDYKQRCHWRLSCYETGIVPDLKVKSPIYYADETIEDEEMDPEKAEYKKKLRCHFRLSCYETGIVPKILKAAIVYKHAEEETPADEITDLKQYCRWKLSCYERMEAELMPKPTETITPVTEKQADISSREPDIEVVAVNNEEDEEPGVDDKQTEDAKEEDGIQEERTREQEETEEMITDFSAHDKDTEENSVEQEEEEVEDETVDDALEEEVGDETEEEVEDETKDDALEDDETESDILEHQECEDQEPDELLIPEPPEDESGESEETKPRQEPTDVDGIPVAVQEPEDLDEVQEEELEEKLEQQDQASEEKEEEDVEPVIIEERGSESHEPEPIVETPYEEQPSEEVQHVDEDEEMLIEKPETAAERQFCHWRLSCYQTGIVPDLKATRTPIITVVIDEDSEISEAERKQLCKWRKSCYETGIVPDLTPKPIIQTVVIVDDEDLSEAAKEYIKKYHCHFRKSCYESGIIPDLKPKRVVPVSQIAEAEEELTIAQLKQRCKWRKECYREMGLDSILQAAQVEKESAAAAAKQETPKPKKAKRKDKKKKHKEEEDVADQTEQEVESEKPAEAEEDTIDKQFCRWRKSCYESGIAPKIVKQTVIFDYGAAEAVDFEETEAQMKLRCHWRTSCYDSGIVPELFKKPAPPPKPSAAPKPAAKEPDADKEEYEKKYRCHFRKSCYDTGVVPDLSKAWAVPLSAIVPESLEEETESAFKQRCRWRLSCYDSGVVPDLTPKPPTPQAVLAEFQDEEVELLQVKVICQYRLSCYETVLETREIKGLSERLQQIQSSAAANAVERARQRALEPKNETKVQLDCSIYRHSCREAHGLPPKPKPHSPDAKKMCRRERRENLEPSLDLTDRDISMAAKQQSSVR